MKLSHSFILLAFTGISVISCKTYTEPKAEEQNDIAVVPFTEVLSLQPTKTIVLPGELQPWNKVSIYSKVKGFVKVLNVDRGSQVRRGDVLAVLDAPEVLSEFDQAKGQLNAAEASYSQSKAKASISRITYERLKEVSKTKGAVSLHELDQAKAQLLSDSSALASAEGNLSAARSHYRTKEELVHYLTISAPFDGTVTERNISPGALISASETARPMFILEDITTLRLTVAIPEIYANALRKDTTISFSVNSVPEKKFNARFGRSSGSVTENNRVMMTEFDIQNKAGELKAGMYAQVNFPIKRAGSTLFVPKQSVVSSSEKTFVIVSNNNKAEWISVKKGMVSDTLVEIFGPLQKGDAVVLQASEEIRDGQEISRKKTFK